MRDVRRDVQRDQGIPEAREVHPGALEVAACGESGRAGEQPDREADGDHERDGEDDRVARDARGAFDRVEHVLPDLEHGDVLDQDDAHDRRGEERLLELGLANEPQFAGGFADPELDGVVGAGLDAVGAQVAVGAVVHGAREAEQRAAGDFVVAVVADGAGLAGLADRAVGAQLDHADASVVAGHAAQEAQVPAKGAPLVERAGGDDEGGKDEQQHPRAPG